MDKYLKKARQIIKDNLYMTIATSSNSGRPWISPLFFAFDEKYNLYWVSNKNSRHSILINKNPKTAIVIFDSRAPEGQGDGVYFETKVVVLTKEKEIKSAMLILNKRVTKEEFKVKKIEDVSGKGIWRIYKAIPLKISKLTEGEFVNGQYIDKRVEIKLK